MSVTTTPPVTEDTLAEVTETTTPTEVAIPAEAVVSTDVAELLPSTDIATEAVVVVAEEKKEEVAPSA